ncbi:MAG: hypothetical protein V4591_10080 [Bdellovibrionota bacterium]
MNLKKIFFLSLFPFFASANSYACSSCGSSATSPLVLNPGENFKMYFGLSQNFNYINYGYAGDKTKKWTDPNITTKDTATLALGYRTSENSFMTLTGSYVRNEGPTNANDPSQGVKEKYLVGDPLLAGRYTLMDMEISSPNRPQIELMAGFKPSFAKNMVDNDGGELDTTGNGFYQTSGGIDFWWGMEFIQFGGAQFVTYSFDRHPDVSLDYRGNRITETKRTRELQYTTVLTVGHAFTEQNFQLQAGVVLDHIGQEHQYYDDGNSYTLPSQQSNSIFTTVNWNMTKLDLVRLSYSYGGAIESNVGPFTNSAQTTSSMLLVAYERTFF